jgi:hypothetical protein
MIKSNLLKGALAALALATVAAPLAASAQSIHVQIGGGRAYDQYYGGYVVYDSYGRWVDDYGNYHYRDGRWCDRWGHWHDRDDWGWRGGGRGYYDRGHDRDHWRDRDHRDYGRDRDHDRDRRDRW